MLKVVNLATPAVTTVLSGNPAGIYLDLDWSNNSSKVAFVASGDSGGRLYIVDVDAVVPSPQQVAGATGDNRSPTWSPDDQFLAFSGKDRTGPVKTYTIRKVQLSTGQQTIVASSTRTDLRWPDWRPFPSTFGPAIAAVTAIRRPKAGNTVNDFTLLFSNSTSSSNIGSHGGAPRTDHGRPAAAEAVVQGRKAQIQNTATQVVDQAIAGFLAHGSGSRLDGPQMRDLHDELVADLAGL